MSASKRFKRDTSNLGQAIGEGIKEGMAMANKIMDEEQIPSRGGKSIGQQKREAFEEAERERRIADGEHLIDAQHLVASGGWFAPAEVMRELATDDQVREAVNRSMHDEAAGVSFTPEGIIVDGVLMKAGRGGTLLTEENIRDVVLAKAKAIINGPREQEYGNKTENFQRIADLWSPILGVKITRSQVAMMMMQVKVARLITSPDHEDSWVDAIGYAAIGAEVQEGASNEQ